MQRSIRIRLNVRLRRNPKLYNPVLAAHEGIGLDQPSSGLADRRLARLPREEQETDLGGPNKMSPGDNQPDREPAVRAAPANQPGVPLARCTNGRALGGGVVQEPGWISFHRSQESDTGPRNTAGIKKP
jgi:hypothetical protein